MDIIDGIVILSADEADRACPLNLKWGISQLAAYGVEVCSESRKLRPLLRCTRLLEAAGLEFKILPEEPEAVELEAVESVTIEPGIPGAG